MVEATHGWLHSILLSHLEIFPEVLISAPPVSVNHTDFLILSDLMEVRVSNIVLNSIGWESSI